MFEQDGSHKKKILGGGEVSVRESSAVDSTHFQTVLAECVEYFKKTYASSEFDGGGTIATCR